MNRKFSYELLLARSKMENDMKESIDHLKQNMLGMLDKDTQDRLMDMKQALNKNESDQKKQR
jgi:hypothetical protein